MSLPDPGVEPAELLTRCHFPTPGALVPLGVSGGPDSVAMAVLAAAAGVDFEIWHVHHGLRAGADHDAELARRVAERLGVPFRQRRVALTAGADLEARAREARYGVLPPDVCVGHTADDRAETVLLNLFRGAGPAGLATPFGRVRRPILRLRRSETRALCRSEGIETADDPMNHDPAFSRVAVRTQLLPLAARIFDRDPIPLLNRHADLVADALEVVRIAAAGIDATDAAALVALPRAVATEAIRTWIRAETGSDASIDAASVDRVLAVARHEVVAAQVVGGHRIARTGGVLRVEPASATPADG